MNCDPKLLQIVELQDELNEKTVPGWRDANLDWDTAILVETAEAIDSCAWKWWKHQEPDIANLKVELVDLLHFVVSKLIVQNSDHSDCLAHVAEYLTGYTGVLEEEGLEVHDGIEALKCFLTSSPP